jgi:hypothetical protein
MKTGQLLQQYYITEMKAEIWDAQQEDGFISEDITGK